MAKAKKIRIRLKAFDHKTLDASVAKIIEAAKSTGAGVVGPVPLPTEKQVYTLLRAVHKYKDSQTSYRHSRNNTKNNGCSNKLSITKWCRHRN